EAAPTRLGAHSAHPRIDVGSIRVVPRERVEVAQRHQRVPRARGGIGEFGELAWRECGVVGGLGPTADVIGVDGVRTQRLEWPTQPRDGLGIEMYTRLANRDR